MKRRKVHITLYAKADEVNFYAIHYNDDDESEPKKFFKKFDVAEFKNDLDTIQMRMEFIGDSGALDRHFRYAGKIDDNAMELPKKEEFSKLRLYCLRLTENIVILGSGGEKETRTYNEDIELNSFVEDLISIDDQIRIKEKLGRIKKEGKDLTGDLTFYI